VSIVIVGFSSTNKRPGFYGETVFGAGAVSIGNFALRLLLVGLKLSTGTATADADVDAPNSADQFDTLYGAGSQLARMGYQALNQSGVSLAAAAVAEAGGAAAGTATITITGSWTTTGDLTYRVDGDVVNVAVNQTMNTVTLVGDAITLAFNSNPRLSVTAGNAAGVVTLTRKSKSASGLDGTLFQDKSKVPTGLITTLTGGAAMAGAGVHFTGSSGAESIVTLAAILFPEEYDRIAVAQNDATNAALWKAHVNNAAVPLEGRLQHVIMGHNGSLANAISLAQTTLNAQRAQVVWQLDGESHPSEIAARFGAMRTAFEIDDSAAIYDGEILTGIRATAARASWPSGASIISALDNGVTPVSSSRYGEAYIERSITTRSRNGSNPDWSTLDTSEAVVPDYARKGLAQIYLLEVKPNNKRIAPNPTADQAERKAGILTPDRWNDRVKKWLKDLEDRTLIIDADLYPPESEYQANEGNDRIMTIMRVKPAPGNHQVGASVRQQ